MTALRKYGDLIGIPMVNTSAILFAGALPSLSVIESVFKILVLAATLIFTVIRIIKMIRKND